MIHSIVLKKLMGRVTCYTDYVNVKIGCQYMFHYKEVCRGVTENHVLARLAVF